MTDTDSFDEFFDLVQKLWPAYRTSREALQAGVWGRLKHEAVAEVGRALHRHRSAYYAHDKPNWQLVVQDIYAMRECNTNDLEILLNNVRQALIELGVKGAADMTHADLYHNHVEANAHMPCLGGDYRKRFAEMWRLWLTERELPIPSYLDE